MSEISDWVLVEVKVCTILSKNFGLKVVYYTHIINNYKVICKGIITCL